MIKLEIQKDYYGQNNHETTRKGFVSNDVFITEPMTSECGRFDVNPMKYYGLTQKELYEIDSFNITNDPSYQQRENMRELEVNMNYKTGRNGENNCRIVSAGSELDKMYEKTYQIYTKSISVNKIDAKAIEQEREWNIFYK